MILYLLLPLALASCNVAGLWAIELTLHDFTGDTQNHAYLLLSEDGSAKLDTSFARGTLVVEGVPLPVEKSTSAVGEWRRTADASKSACSVDVTLTAFIFNDEGHAATFVRYELTLSVVKATQALVGGGLYSQRVLDHAIHLAQPQSQLKVVRGSRFVIAGARVNPLQTLDEVPIAIAHGKKCATKHGLYVAEFFIAGLSEISLFMMKEDGSAHAVTSLDAGAFADTPEPLATPGSGVQMGAWREEACGAAFIVNQLTYYADGGNEADVVHRNEGHFAALAGDGASKKRGGDDDDDDDDKGMHESSKEATASDEHVSHYEGAFATRGFHADEVLHMASPSSSVPASDEVVFTSKVRRIVSEFAYVDTSTELPRTSSKSCTLDQVHGVWAVDLTPTKLTQEGYWVMHLNADGTAEAIMSRSGGAKKVGDDVVALDYTESASLGEWRVTSECEVLVVMHRFLYEKDGQHALKQRRVELRATFDAGLQRMNGIFHTVLATIGSDQIASFLLPTEDDILAQATRKFLGARIDSSFVLSE